MDRIPGVVVYYRRPFSVYYEGLLALYSNHSSRRGDAHEQHIIEFLKKEFEIDPTPKWYWDMDLDSCY